MCPYFVTVFRFIHLWGEFYRRYAYSRGPVRESRNLDQDPPFQQPEPTISIRTEIIQCVFLSRDTREVSETKPYNKISPTNNNTRGKIDSKGGMG